MKLRNYPVPCVTESFLLLPLDLAITEQRAKPEEIHGSDRDVGLEIQDGADPHSVSVTLPVLRIGLLLLPRAVRVWHPKRRLPSCVRLLPLETLFLLRNRILLRVQERTGRIAPR